MKTFALLALALIAASSAAKGWWIWMDYHGRNWIRDLFLRPGVKVRLINRTGRIVARRGKSREIVVWVDDEQAQFFGRTETWWMGNLRIILALCLAVSTAACGGALAGGTFGGSTPVHGSPTEVPKQFAAWNTFDVIPCGAPAHGDHCDQPIAGVVVKVHTGTNPDRYDTRTSNADGYTLFSEPEALVDSDITFEKDGYLPQTIGVLVRDLVGQHNIFPLYPKVPPLPAPPTRDEILTLRITFQGLTCATQQFGPLPWFEAALPWLTPADRASCYAAKHASPAWGPGGDTHAIINLPSGPPLYDEPGQPYSADRFPALDWTTGGTHIDGRLADLVAEVARAGFNRQLLFLGGDDGARGFLIAMAQLDLAYQALRVESIYGDLGPYVVVLPGWDGVFYGYSPDQVATWGAKCRSLFLYCGLEHQPGRIPVGEGGSDYLPGGRMASFDLLLAEFDGPGDSAWRTAGGRDALGRADYHGNQIWQIGARMLGPRYRRPSDQPSDADSASPPFYLAPSSPRGPYVHCAFEWVGEYLFVRDRESAADIVRDRAYFQSLGYTCGG